MQRTLERHRTDSQKQPQYLLPLMVIGLVLLFFAAPWSWQHKAHAALHGLCAQTPSHTFQLGNRPLPFDARMTGIYGGFIVSMGYLLAIGRHRAAKLPGWSVMGAVALLVGAMAVDGFNSLFLDLGQRNLYQPDNRLRLITGIGTGIALASVLCYLFAVSLWRQPNMRERVLRWRDVAILIPAQLPFALLVVSGWDWLSFPVTMLLLVSALCVLTSLSLVAIVLFKQIDYTFVKATDLQSTAATAVLTALAIMALLSGGRFFLEHLLGIPPLT